MRNDVGVSSLMSQMFASSFFRKFMGGRPSRDNVHPKAPRLAAQGKNTATRVDLSVRCCNSNSGASTSRANIYSAHCKCVY